HLRDEAPLPEARGTSERTRQATCAEHLRRGEGCRLQAHASRHAVDDDVGASVVRIARVQGDCAVLLQPDTGCCLPRARSCNQPLGFGWGCLEVAAKVAPGLALASAKPLRSSRRM